MEQHHAHQRLAGLKGADKGKVVTAAEAVQLIAGRCEIEVSGGVNLNTVRAIAEQGVNYISVGALTHSAPSVNLSMDIID